MKRILLILVAAIMLSGCSGEKTYTINGHITGDSDALFNGIAILSNRDSESPIRDTVQIIQNKFTFTGSVQTPQYYYLSIQNIPGRVTIFLENDTYTITGEQDNFSKSEIKGGKSQPLFNEYNNHITEVTEKYNIQQLIKDIRMDGVPQERKEEAESLYNACNDELEQYRDSMMRAHELSHFYLHHFNTIIDRYPLDSAIGIKDQFKAIKEFAGNKTLLKVEEYLNRELALQKGEIAPDMTFADPSGNMITLSDIYKKNKITMIDFWAGWCGPCRNFNPTLLKIYNEYNKLGFEIYGVSLDRKKEDWVKAIEEDKLPWIHVSELKYWNGEGPKLYNVKYIPQNVFVDQEGRIIGRQLAEEEIVPLLKEHLSK